MKRLTASRAFALSALMVASLVQAAPTQFATDHLLIDFDPETFSFSRDVGGWGGSGSEDISPLSLAYTQVERGVKMDFNGQMSLYATAYANLSPQSLIGYFNAHFAFTPDAGYAITGYTITYDGSFILESPASVSLGAPGVSLYESTGGGSFSLVGNIAGSAAPSLIGNLGATGDVQTIQVFDGYVEQFSHYEDVLDYCEAENPEVCYYRQEPVYIQVPVYHDEMDLGEATLNLQSITVQAQVVAVPEPGTVALVLAALPLAAGVVRRRRVAHRA